MQASEKELRGLAQSQLAAVLMAQLSTLSRKMAEFSAESARKAEALSDPKDADAQATYAFITALTKGQSDICEQLAEALRDLGQMVLENPVDPLTDGDRAAREFTGALTEAAARLLVRRRRDQRR